MRRVIPEQTQLVLHPYSIHRDPRNFHTPEAFSPERWFGTSAPAGGHNTPAFFPFSYEPTICPGKNLALMEMCMVLCWVNLRFRFSKAPGVSEEWEGTGLLCTRIHFWSVSRFGSGREHSSSFCWWASSLVSTNQWTVGN